MLHTQYASQTPKRETDSNQHLEIEVAAEKPRRFITTDGLFPCRRRPAPPLAAAACAQLLPGRPGPAHPPPAARA